MCTLIAVDCCWQANWASEQLCKSTIVDLLGRENSGNEIEPALSRWIAQEAFICVCVCSIIIYRAVAGELAKLEPTKVPLEVGRSGCIIGVQFNGSNNNNNNSQTIDRFSRRLRLEMGTMIET